MGVAQPFVDVWDHMVALKPRFISKKPHFSFITVHYMFITGLAIVGSILLYPAGNMAYIDALFLASGASTQSGLNTVDINLLNTYQQVVLALLPMLSNPITINTFVVFLRLYWFEKRFQGIAKEAKAMRKTRTLSRSRSQNMGERDLDREEKGVNGRQITVMHQSAQASGKAEGMIASGPEGILHGNIEKNEQLASSGDSNSIKSNVIVEEEDELRPGIERVQSQPQIKFAHRVKRSDGVTDMNDDLRIPQKRSDAEHLAFLERQRNPSDKGVLRIPGPRDQERGASPQQIAEDDADRIARIMSRRGSDHVPEDIKDLDLAADTVAQDHAENDLNNHHEDAEQPPVRRGITISEPPRPEPAAHIVEDAHAAVHTLGVLRLRKPRLFDGDDASHQDAPLHKLRSRATFTSLRNALSQENADPAPYLSWQPTIGRNSAFVDLSEQQREELGGIEYRSLKSLALILVFYFWGFMFLGIICLTPWIQLNDSYGSVVDADGQSRLWWGFFTGISSFTDLGYTLTPDSMISFQTAIWPLLAMSYLIIVGNTGFPIMLRAAIWMLSKVVPQGSGIWEELQFLLDHPRRCFTLLFPANATWWLFWILVILNGTDLVFFIILDLGNSFVTSLPTNIRVLDGWFQAVSTRTAGFACVNLANLHPAIQVSYLVMMYISVLPIAISVRRTNVYEEKSLGIWGSANEENEDEGEPSYVGAHLRRQLSFDLWYIFLGLFVIAIVEGNRLQSSDPTDQTAFTLFSVLFEVVSAYGTVGLSLGYPTINASFSAEFSVISKLVIIAMQIRGRHRGLPYELDRAILLPSESLHEKENQDATLRMQRRNSMATTQGGENTSMPGGFMHGATRRKSTSSQRPNSSGNLLSNLLHPGPTIPNSLRHVSHHLHPSETHATDAGMHEWERRNSGESGRASHRTFPRKANTD